MRTTLSSDSDLLTIAGEVAGLPSILDKAQKASKPLIKRESAARLASPSGVAPELCIPSHLQCDTP